MSSSGSHFDGNEAVWLGGLVERALSGKTETTVYDALEPGDEDTVVEFNGNGQIDLIYERVPEGDDSILMEIKSGKPLTTVTVQFSDEMDTVPDIVGDNMVGIGGPAGRTVTTVFLQDPALENSILVTAKSGSEVPMFLQRLTQSQGGQQQPTTQIDLVTAVREGKVKLQDLPTATRRLIEEKLGGKSPVL